VSAKEFLTIAGSAAGLIVAAVTVFERLLSIRERLSSKTTKKRTAETTRDAEAKPRLRLFRVSPFLFRQEILIIAGAGVVLNYVGLALSVQLKSVLYLDMSGTAVTALLLGPWWGGAVGLISNFVNWLLYPESGADKMIFPWSLVNMAGGIFWGYMGRRANFRTYVKTGGDSDLPHLRYLATFGFLGAFVMSIFGTGIQAALAGGALDLNPQVSSAVDRLLSGLQDLLLHPLQEVFGPLLGPKLAWAVPTWLENWIRYIPDKTISAAMALAIIKHGLPLFERELILAGPRGVRPRDDCLGPLTMAVLYVPYFVVFLSVSTYNGAHFWIFWSLPWLIICYGIVTSFFSGEGSAALSESRRRRYEVYSHAFKQIRYGAGQLPGGLWFATVLASTAFVLGLPILGLSMAALYRVALNFFCVIYGFLFGMQLIFIMVAQNREIQLAGGLTRAHSSELPARPVLTREKTRAGLDAAEATARAVEPDDG